MLGGLWSEWTDLKKGEVVPNFTMLTTNCDAHPPLKRLHKPDPSLTPETQDKRSLVHIAPADWEQWLRGALEEALPLIRPPPLDDYDMADVIAYSDTT